MQGSVVLVHGTGVRFDGYAQSLSTLRERLSAVGMDKAIVPCGWGEPLGVSFSGRSLPDPPGAAQLEREAEELARWSWLLADPLAEMERLAIRGARQAAQPPGKPAWLNSLERIASYVPSIDATMLLTRAGVADLWGTACATVIPTPIVRLAFERSAEAGELPDAIAAAARAVAAELHRRAIETGRPGPSAELRARLCRLLTEDWGGAVAGLGTFLSDMLKRSGTAMLRGRRNGLNAAIAAPIGDILLYQSRGSQIRAFIRNKVENAAGPVVLIAHSLGGVACVDLLSSADPPLVDALVTFGSQAAFFHELGALASLKEGEALPAGFPPWLNVFDRSDFLSFFGGRMFPGQVTDLEVHSGQPFPDSHSAYIGNPEMWTAIADFVRR